MKIENFIGRHLIPLILVLVAANLALVFLGPYGASLLGKHQLKDLPATLGLPQTSTQRSRSASGRTASLLNVRLVSGADDSLATAVARVRPAVVHIKAAISADRLKTASSSGIYFDTPVQPGAEAKNSIGSGVIVDRKGYIVTNYHVIAGAMQISVSVFGFQETVYPAEIIKTAPEADLAVLKINSKDSLPSAVLGNSSLMEVANSVLAIGSPFGLEHTVTKGIISDNKRDLEIEGRPYRDMIQTDAAINRGNSGGPLINVEGKVIGINTAIYAPTGIFTGIGFAIPVNKVRLLLAQVG